MNQCYFKRSNAITGKTIVLFHVKQSTCNTHNTQKAGKLLCGKRCFGAENDSIEQNNSGVDFSCEFARPADALKGCAELMIIGANCTLEPGKTWQRTTKYAFAPFKVQFYIYSWEVPSCTMFVLYSLHHPVEMVWGPTRMLTVIFIWIKLKSRSRLEFGPWMPSGRSDPGYVFSLLNTHK